MAPSFNIGNPQRSLVRIPGSGQDKTLKPICLDVAQINNFSSSLGRIMNFDFKLSQEQTIGGTLSILQAPPSLTSAIGLRQQRSSEDSQQASGSSRKRSSDEELERASKRPLIASPIRTNASLNDEERLEKMERLKLSKAKLEEENEELSKKVTTFKNILRNRNRLDEFLKALDELSC